RALALLALGVGSLVVSVLGLSVVGTPTPRALIALPAMILLGTVIVTIFWWRTVLSSEFNRKSLMCLYLILLMLISGRVLGVAGHLTPAAHFMRDCFMIAAGLGVAAVFTLRWIAIIAVMFYASGALCALFPERSMLLLAVTASLAL